MTLDEVIADLSARIRDGSPAAVVRVIRRSAEEASIRAYAPVEDETAIKEATQEITLSLLTNDGLDVQVLVYDIATSLPPAEE
jgi:hypothetical protein